MNSLSVLIYIASIISGVQALLVVVGLTLVALYVIIRLSIATSNDSANYIYSGKKVKPYPPVYQGLALPIILFTLAILIPSKETIYLIAGSEAGEYVVNTPEAKEIMTDIHTIIKGQLKEMTGD